MAAAAGGIDALVFTGGIGERSPRLRRTVAERLAFLGVGIGTDNERVADADADVSGPGAGVRVLVVHAREDIELARDAREVLRVPGGSGSAVP